MKKKRYSEYKPKECQYCYYWYPEIGCELGEEHCYYLLPEEPEEEACPYAKNGSCVGWCSMVLLGHAVNPPCKKKKER